MQCLSNYNSMLWKMPKLTKNILYNAKKNNKICEIKVYSHEKCLFDEEKK